MGILRVLLALSVVSFHVWPAGPLSFVDAGTAVYCFFVLSGFYMALVLNEKYTWSGATKAFYIARFFRLWPTYALSLLIVVVGLIIAGDLHARLSILGSLSVPAAAAVILANLSLFGTDLFSHLGFGPDGMFLAEPGRANGPILLLNVPAWSLSIELLFYAAAPFVVRSPRRTLAFFAVGLAFWLIVRFAGARPTTYRIDLMYPGLCAYFGLGAASYWAFRRRIIAGEGRYLLAGAMCALTLASSIPGGPITYLALGMAADAVLEASKDFAADRFLGDLSYPLYILHVPLFHLFLALGVPDAMRALHTALIITACVAVTACFERPLFGIRQWLSVRRAARSGDLAARRGCGGEGLVAFQTAAGTLPASRSGLSGQ